MFRYPVVPVATVVVLLTLADRQTKFFNQEDVPSFHARVTLPGGGQFMLHGMHPVAPVPNEKYPDNQGEKEVAFSVGTLERLPAFGSGHFPMYARFVLR